MQKGNNNNIQNLIGSKNRKLINNKKEIAVDVLKMKAATGLGCESEGTGMGLGMNFLSQ